MSSLLRITARFVSLGVLTVLVFFGGLLVRLTQSNSDSKEKLSKNFGLNTVHADTPAVQGVVEGATTSPEGGACETESSNGGDPNGC